MSWSISWAWTAPDAWSMLVGLVRYERAFTLYLIYFSVRVSW